MNELIPNANNQQRLRGQVEFEVSGRIQQPSQANQTVVTYQPGRIPGTLTQQIIKKYDKDSDFELSREEIGFDDPTFARLDADANGKLDGEELDVWRTGPADLEVSLSLAPKAVDCIAKLVTDAGDLAVRPSNKWKRPTHHPSGLQPIEFWAYATVINSGQQQSLSCNIRTVSASVRGKGFILTRIWPARAVNLVHPYPL